jgi:hypothetical protein
MAEINDAYEALRREDVARDHAARGRGAGAEAATPPSAPRRGGPPRPRPQRPVTGRVDTSETFRPRNATFGTKAGGDRGYASTAGLRGHAPRPSYSTDREPPRASQPTSPPERGRIHRFRAPAPPSLDVAMGVALEFGKFRGHTLGEVAAFEPSYVDWLAQTITRDRDLVAAARVVRDELDRRGVVRRQRPGPAPAGRSA